MKQTLWNGLLAATVMLSAASCSDDKYSSPDTGTGTVNLSLDVDGAVISATSSRAGLDEIAGTLSADDFTIRLTDAKGESQQWSYNDFNGSHVRIGDYTLEAFYGSADDEGFEKPFFAGSTNLKVTTDATTDAAVTATLANAAILVKYTDAFTGYMTDYEASVRTAGSTDGLTYPADATDELFVNPGDASLYVKFTTPQGKTATLKAAEFTTQARHRYTVTVDVNGGEIGDAVLSVTFDDTTLKADKEIVLSDELLNMPAPIVTPASTTLDIIEGNSADAKMNIVARAGLAAVKMTTESPSLIAKGWPAEIDLLKADAAMQSKLTSLGLKATGLWKNPDMMAVVDFTDAIAQIGATEGADNTSAFRIEVEDNYGKISDPAGTLTVNVTPVKFEITGHDMVLINQQEIKLNVVYNGGDLARDVKFMYHTTRDTWEEAPIVSATAKTQARTGSDTWDVTLRVEATQTDIELRATALSLPTVNYTIERGVPDFTLSANDNDAFATYATIAVSADNDDIAASVAGSAVWQISTDGGTSFTDASNVTIDGNRVVIHGLTPSRSHTIRATLAGKSQTAALTTEAATPLENGDMEQWHKVDGKTSHWWIDYPGESTSTIWGTLNLYTTSEGGSTTSALNSNRDGNAYNAISGTTSTTDAANGSQHAALIRTVGWGRGNGVGNTAFEKCNHITQGELFLGTPTNTLAQNYGIAFGSRPSGVTFSYKYVPRNGIDFGSATIEVYDASGAKIAEDKMIIKACDQYTQTSLKLDYKAGAPKASKLSVIFRSSENPECLVVSKENLDGYKTTGVSADKTLLGSHLYIDDITLNY